MADVPENHWAVMFQEPEEEPWTAEQWRQNLIEGMAARCASAMWISRPHENLTRDPPEDLLMSLTGWAKWTEDEKALFCKTYNRELELLGFRPSRWTRLAK